MSQEMAQRVLKLEARLDAIERRLGISQPAPAEARIDTPQISSAVPAAIPAVAEQIPDASLAPAATVRVGARPPPLPTLDRNRARAATPDAPAIGYEPVKPSAPPATEDSLEQAIGLKWAGWIGAVVLVVAAGLGIKFAYDNGWFGAIPITLKLVLMWAGSFTLIGLGELVFRRVNKLSAVGLFGAGVACMFLVSYSGHAFLGAYDPRTAFVLMGVSSIVGAAVAMRGRMASVAILALIGGNLAPLLLGSRGQSQILFLAYLLVLQVMALVLAWWGGSRRWWTLRGLSLVTTSVWTLATLGSGVWDSGWIDPRHGPACFIILFAVLYQLELLLSARGRTANERVGSVFSAIVTAAFTSAMLLIYRDNWKMVNGAMVTAVAASCAALALLCSRRRGETGDALGLLASGYWIQAIVLLVIAVPVSFTGWALVAGWAALSVCFTTLGVRTRRDDQRILGAVTWALSVAYFVHRVLTHWTDLRDDIAITLIVTAIPEFLLVALALVLTGHLVAWVMLRRLDNPDRARDELTTCAHAVMICGGVVWVAMSAAAMPATAASIAILLYAWFCVAMDGIAPKMKWIWHAVGALAVVTVKWTLIDIVAQRLSTTGSLVVLNSSMALGCAIALSLLSIWRLKHRAMAAALHADSKNFAALPMVLAVIAMMTVGLSIEAERAVRYVAGQRALTFPTAQTIMLVWTMLWSASGAAVVGALRLLRPRPGNLAFGATIVVMLVAKFLVLDFLAFRIPTGVAARSMVGLNLQMLACLGLFGILALTYWVNRDGERDNRGAVKLLAVVAVGLGWFVVSMEIDRWAASRSPSWIVRQAGFSIWWSLYAMILIIGGFRLRLPALRYAGLALFAVTLGKVVLIDLSTAAKGIRIVSFFGLGVLLLSTSVIYGRLSPRLLPKIPPAP